MALFASFVQDAPFCVVTLPSCRDAGASRQETGMAGNKPLGKAKEAKNDEFYTQFADIEREAHLRL